MQFLIDNCELQDSLHSIDKKYNQLVKYQIKFFPLLERIETAFTVLTWFKRNIKLATNKR